MKYLGAIGALAAAVLVVGIGQAHWVTEGDNRCSVDKPVE